MQWQKQQRFLISTLGPTWLLWLKFGASKIAFQCGVVKRCEDPDETRKTKDFQTSRTSMSMVCGHARPPSGPWITQGAPWVVQDLLPDWMTEGQQLSRPPGRTEHADPGCAQTRHPAAQQTSPGIAHHPTPRCGVSMPRSPSRLAFVFFCVANPIEIATRPPAHPPTRQGLVTLPGYHPSRPSRHEHTPGRQEEEAAAV